MHWSETEINTLKSNANNLITHAEEYVRVAIKKKSNEPEWFEKQAITFEQYYGGFLYWFKNVCGQNIEEYENLEEFSHKYSYENLSQIIRNYKPDEKYRPLSEMKVEFDDILFEGYAAFFEIDSSTFETTFDRKLYTYFIHHHNKTELTNIVEEMITFKNE